MGISNELGGLSDSNYVEMQTYILAADFYNYRPHIISS